MNNKHISEQQNKQMCMTLNLIHKLQLFREYANFTWHNNTTQESLAKVNAWQKCVYAGP